MTQAERDVIIKTLYWGMWTSADFEELFRRDWFATYQMLKEGEEDKVPDFVLAMIRQWVLDEEEEDE